MKKTIAVASIVFLLAQCLIFTAAATSAEGVSHSRQNIVFVIDGSGSLISVNKKPGSDRNGLRYEAIRQFLGFMNEKGNYVNAIVFNGIESEKLQMEDALVLNTGLIPVNGKADKEDFFQQIKAAKVGGSTDIGTALLSAAQSLRDNKTSAGLPSAIILLTDGKTDLPTKKLMDASVKNKEEAIAIADRLGIPIHCICLNVNNWADVDEMRSIADATGGRLIEVNSAEDLDTSYRDFYMEIFGGTIFGASGTLGEYRNSSFVVPSVGVEEVNISIKSSRPVNWVLSTPGGSEMTELSNPECYTEINANHKLIKLSEPLPGLWTLKLDGDEDTLVEFDWVYNLDVSAGISIDEELSKLHTGGKAVVNLWLNQNGERLSAPGSYEGYDCELLVTAPSGRSLAVPAENAENGITMSLDIAENGEYVMQAVFRCGDITISSPQLTFKIQNSPPELGVESPYKIRKILLPFVSEQSKIDLGKIFTDIEDEELVYSLQNADEYGEDVMIKDGILTVEAKKLGSAEFIVSAKDSAGASVSVTVVSSVLNLTPLLLALLVMVALFITIMVLMKKAKKAKAQKKMRIPGIFSVWIESGSFSGQESEIAGLLQARQRVKLSDLIKEYLDIISHDDLQISSTIDSIKRAVQQHSAEISKHSFVPHSLTSKSRDTNKCIWMRDNTANAIIQYGTEHIIIDFDDLRVYVKYLDPDGNEGYYSDDDESEAKGLDELDSYDSYDDDDQNSDEI